MLSWRELTTEDENDTGLSLFRGALLAKMHPVGQLGARDVRSKGVLRLGRRLLGVSGTHCGGEEWRGVN